MTIEEIKSKMNIPVLVEYMRLNNWQWQGQTVTESMMEDCLDEMLPLTFHMHVGCDSRYGGFTFSCMEKGKIKATFKKWYANGVFVEKPEDLVNFTYEI